MLVTVNLTAADLVGSRTDRVAKRALELDRETPVGELRYDGKTLSLHPADDFRSIGLMDVPQALLDDVIATGRAS